VIANYKYSLTGAQQSAIQVFLRTLPDSAIKNALGGTAVFNFLHGLTYADDWTKEPLYPTVDDKGDRKEST
jgi:hypothetical protein